MKIFIKLFVTGICMLALAAQEMRPIRDDVGFCWNPKSMQKLVDYLESQEKENFKTEGLVAAISPHDDYLYAGRVYYPLFKILKAKEVVIFGVTHGAVRNEIGDLQNILILDGFKYWPGLKESIVVSGLRKYLKERLDKTVFITNKGRTFSFSSRLTETITEKTLTTHPSEKERGPGVLPFNSTSA